jgi:hypothetical protein
MKEKITQIGVASLIAMCFSTSLLAEDIEFSYNSAAGASTYVIGTGKKETYDIAIRIKDDALVGTKIKSITVPFISTLDASKLTDTSVWLTSALSLNSEVNSPDILSCEATVADGKMEVTLPEEYTLTRDGVYVGYSFTIGTLVESTKSPIVVVESDSEDGLYIHTNRTYKSWTSAANGAASALSVTLDGNFKANVATFDYAEDNYFMVGRDGNLSAKLVNHGTSGIESVEYTYAYDDVSGSGLIELPTKIPGIYGGSAIVDIPLKISDKAWEGNIVLRVDKVNGAANEAATGELSASLPINIVEFMPVNRPVVEEYTGTWCGFCPRGFIGLREMSDRYPDDFIGLSFHASQGASIDPMQFTSGFPNTVTDFPDAWLNRTLEMDAYFGDTVNEPLGIEKTWNNARTAFCPIEVAGTAEWDVSELKINIQGEVRSVKSVSDAPYRMAYAVIHDDMHCPADADTQLYSHWAQTNSYSGTTRYGTDEYLDEFINLGSVVQLHYNDVVVMFPDMLGVRGSLPINIKAGQKYTHNYVIDVTNPLNSSGTPIIQDYHKLRVVAMVIDSSTGAIVNAIKVPITGEVAGVKDIEANDSGVESAVYYNLQGCRVENPDNGIYMKSELHKDGRRTVSKVMIHQ